MERARLGQIRSEFSARHFNQELSDVSDEVEQVRSRIAETVSAEMLQVFEVRVFGAEDASPVGEYEGNVYGLVGED